jgi:hypothetical protein
MKDAGCWRTIVEFSAKSRTYQKMIERLHPMVAKTILEGYIVFCVEQQDNEWTTSAIRRLAKSSLGFLGFYSSKLMLVTKELGRKRHMSVAQFLTELSKEIPDA